MSVEKIRRKMRPGSITRVAPTDTGDLMRDIIFLLDEIERKDKAIEQAVDDIDDRQYGAARWTLCKATEEASDEVH